MIRQDQCAAGLRIRAAAVDSPVKHERDVDSQDEVQQPDSPAVSATPHRRRQQPDRDCGVGQQHQFSKLVRRHARSLGRMKWSDWLARRSRNTVQSEECKLQSAKSRRPPVDCFDNFHFALSINQTDILSEKQCLLRNDVLSIVCNQLDQEPFPASSGPRAAIRLSRGRNSGKSRSQPPIANSIPVELISAKTSGRPGLNGRQAESRGAMPSP